MDDEKIFDQEVERQMAVLREQAITWQEAVKKGGSCGQDYAKITAALKSTGEPRVFSTGAVRDASTTKPPMDLLPQDLLARVAFHYGLGAAKYGIDNWRKGQPQNEVLASLERHILAYRKGDTTEDHLAAVVWNALSLLNVDEYMKDNADVYNIFGQYPKGDNK